MTKKSDAPAIRFKGFSDAWEQRKLSEITDKVTEKNAGLQYVETFTNSAEFGIISQRDFFDHDIAKLGSLDGYYIVKTEDFVYNPRISTSAPVGPINRNKLGRTGVMSPLYTVFRPHDIDTTYLEYFFKCGYWHSFMNFNGDSGARSDRFSIRDNVFFQMPIPIPDIDEQRKIGELLTCLDNLITLHQRKFEKLTNVKKSMLEKMFPQNGSSYPEIRFKGFTDPWEQRKLGDMMNVTSVKRIHQSDWTDSGVRFLRARDIVAAAKNEEPDDYLYISKEKYEEYSTLSGKVGVSDLLVTGVGTIGVPYLVRNLEPLYFKDGNIIWFQNSDKIDGKFLFYSFSAEQIQGFINESAGIGTVGTYTIESGKKTPISLPNQIEQAKVGEFFQQLDNLITLHQRKCALLFSPFQAFISMMFTTSTFSWEQRKFDEVFDCTVPNNTLSRAELSYDEGTVLNVHYGDVLIKYGSVLDVQKDDIPRIPHRCREDFNGALLQDGDVIIADTAEDETTGKACEIGNLQGSAIVSGLHTMVCRPRNRMALGYLGYYLNSNAYHHQLLPLMQGIKVLSLSRSNIQKTSVSYPIAVKEQQLIAYYFSQLDNLITLHQRKCIFFTGRAGRLISTVNKKRITSSWEQRKLGDIADIVGGGTPSTGNQSYWDGDIDWYASAEIADQIYANSSQKKITGLGYENSSAKMLPPGTVLFTSRAGIGKTAILTRKGCTNQGFQSIVPHRGELDSYFIFSRTEELKRYGEFVGAGSTFVEVSGKQMAVMELMMPPTMREQQTIGGFFQQLDHLITLHQRKPFLMKWRTSDANRNQTNRLVL